MDQEHDDMPPSALRAITPATNGNGSGLTPATPQPLLAPVSMKTIRQMMAAGTAFACLTCYDATTARWLQRAGVPVLLVGDSAAEVILGHRRTIDMPMDVLVALTAAVKRGAPDAFIMADMPFMSYQADENDALHNAARFLTEGQADIVKLEGDESFAKLVQKMTRAGIPVCAHIGSRPQTSAITGGYRAAGRTRDEADQIVRDAVALEAAGALMLLVEAVPDEVTERIMKSTQVPLIGIGAGPACHGQVLVLQDLLGMSDYPPRFAEPATQMGPAIAQAAADWVSRVAQRNIGGRRYAMKIDVGAGPTTGK